MCMYIHKNINVVTWCQTPFRFVCMTRGSTTGGARGCCHPPPMNIGKKEERKGKKERREISCVFHVLCMKITGFWHIVNVKNQQLQGASPPDPHQGPLPLDPRYRFTPGIYPSHHPCVWLICHHARNLQHFSSNLYSSWRSFSSFKIWPYKLS